MPYLNSSAPGETILLVEDDARMRAAMGRTLGGLGYRLLEAEDVAAALAVLESGIPVQLLLSTGRLGAAMREPVFVRRVGLLQPDMELLIRSDGSEDDLADRVRHMFNNREQIRQLREELERPVRSRRKAG